jgi:hypothetical protein
MKRRAAYLRRHKQQVLVWTGVADLDWPAGCRVTMEVDELEEWLKDKSNYGSFVFLDEAAILYDEATRKNHPTVHGLFMRGRHKGYTCYIATQYPTSIPRRNRINCAECYTFRLGDEESAKQVWGDYNRLSIEGKPLWQIIMQLPQLQCLHIISPETVELIQL